MTLGVVMPAAANAARWLLALTVITAVLPLSSCALLRKGLKLVLPTDATKEERVKRYKQKMGGTVRSYLGVRYRMGGMNRSGIDCSGLMVRIYESVGIKLPHSAEDQYDVGRSVSMGSAQFGDLIFFNTKKLFNRPCTAICGALWTSADVPLLYGITHTGMYLGDGMFVHAASQGVTRTKVEDPYWEVRRVAVRRVLEDFDE